jgi:hypothetical protein
MNTDAAEGSVRRDVCIEEQVCLALPKRFKGSLVASASRERDIQLLPLLTCIVDFDLMILSYRLLGDAPACNQRSRSTTCSKPSIQAGTSNKILISDSHVLAVLKSVLTERNDEFDTRFCIISSIILPHHYHLSILRLNNQMLCSSQGNNFRAVGELSVRLEPRTKYGS